MANKRAKQPKAQNRPLDANARVGVLHGKEAYLRTLHTERLIDAIKDAHGDVDVIRFGGAQAAIADVLDECRSVGLMRTYKLVVVDDAERLVNEATRPALQRYAETPCDGATLLLCADAWRRGNLDKAIQSVGTILKCDTPEPDKAAVWAAHRAHKRYGAAMDQRAARRLVGRVGAGLGKLDAEVAKLAAVANDATITETLVLEHTKPTREEEVWAVQERLLTGSAGQAIAGVREAVGVWRQPPALVMYACVDLARKLHTAAAELERGAPMQAASKAARVWGQGGQRVMQAARRAGQGEWAGVLGDAVEADRRCKSGMASFESSLDAVAIRLAGVLR